MDAESCLHIREPCHSKVKHSWKIPWNWNHLKLCSLVKNPESFEPYLGWNTEGNGGLHHNIKFIHVHNTISAAQDYPYLTYSIGVEILRAALE